MSNSPRICRVCMSDAIESQSVTLFNGTDETRSTRSYVSKIEECTGIKILPIPGVLTLICEPCVRKLLVAHNFRVMFQGNNTAFIDMFGVFDTTNTESIKPEIIENEAQLYYDTFSEYLDNEHESPCDDQETVSYSTISDFNYACGDETDDGDGNSNEHQAIGEEKEDVCTEFVEQGIVCNSNGSDNHPGGDLGKRVQRKSKRGRPHSKSARNKKFICNHCNNSYSNQNTLNSHIDRHLNVKRFGCEICNKGFSSTAELKRHIRMHNGDKPYKCQYCERTFADRSAILRHERTHTNERPYECPICHKTFTYANVLKSHQLIHTGEKSFTCEPCAKRFSRKHQLAQHLATMTHKETLELHLYD